MDPKVCIVVLNFNGRECLLAALQSLSLLQYSNKTIIVIDNHSSDGSYEVAQKAFPGVVYLRNDLNMGFSGGMNVGMKAALGMGALWCWLFNYDATAEPEALSVLIDATQRYPEGGLFSPMVLNSSDGSVWFESGRVCFSRMRIEHRRSRAMDSQEIAFESSFLSGCALMIRRDVIESVGFFDERFFLYYEDADYCFRAGRAGFGRYVVPRARVRHEEKSRTNVEKLYHLVFSGLLYFQKWTPWYWRPYLAVYVRMRRIKNWIDCLWRPTQKKSFAVRRAYRDFADQSKMKDV